MNQITTTTTANTLPALDRETAMIVRDLVCWTPDDPTKPVELTRCLSAMEADTIRRRIASLRASLDARDPEAVRRAITALMLGIPSAPGVRSSDGDEPRLVRAAYAQTLSDLPVWAVTDAVGRAARGQLVPGHNPAFMPAAAEIHQLAAAISAPVRAEVARLQRILAGVVAPREPIRSREERLAIATHRQANAARESLAERASELGLDPEDALASVPDAPVRDGPLQRLGYAP